MVDRQAQRAGACGAAVRDRNTISQFISDWSNLTGRPKREWWDAARADGLKAGCGNKAVFAWFRAAITKATPQPVSSKDAN